MRTLVSGFKKSQLANTGYYTQDNFLSAELFSDIKSYIQEKRKDDLGTECYPDVSGKPSFKRWDFKLSKSIEDKLLTEIGSLSTEVSNYLGISKNFQPTFSILGLQKITPDRDDSDVENIAHADTFFNTIKGFVYLDDVTEKNGPYTFYEGSQALSFRRMKHEYLLSVYKTMEQNSWNSIPGYYKLDTDKRKRLIIPDNLLSRYKKIEFTNKANTLIVSDNFGFHHRGDFANQEERFLILINFRKAENSAIRNILNK